MREFVLYSRKGFTCGEFESLRNAGRLDIVAHCLLASCYLSHRLRENVAFHAVLHGPPNPPLHICFKSWEMKGIGSCEEELREQFKRILSSKERSPFPGVLVEKRSFQELIKQLSHKPIYILHEKGIDVREIELEESAVFVLGDHIGLPKKEEEFVERYARAKISVGKLPLFASHCIVLINNELDRKFWR